MEGRDERRLVSGSWSARRYYLFDSLEGLPTAQEIDGEKALAAA